jgi:hypothetical protein
LLEHRQRAAPGFVDRPRQFSLTSNKTTLSARLKALPNDASAAQMESGQLHDVRPASTSPTMFGNTSLIM